MLTFREISLIHSNRGGGKMLWLLLLMIVFVVFFGGIALVMRSANASHEKNLDDKAVVLHAKIQREKPESFAASMERDEFKAHYLATIKSRNMSTVVPGIMAFFILLLSVVYGGLQGIFNESALAFFLPFIVGLLISVFIGKTAIDKHKRTNSDAWLLGQIEKGAKS